MLVPKFTEDFRKAELQKGERSLFYFITAILGFDAWDERLKRSTIRPFHRDLCHFLEGRAPHHPWNEAVVCGFRGCAKSTIATKGYVWWRGLYVPNFSCKILGNSSDNVKLNHFGPMLNLFLSSDRADYLQWLYSHRIPSSFAGWSKEQVTLIQTNAAALPFLTYQGLDSKLESYHGNLIVLDDPEGADAEKSRVGNEEAWVAYENAHPLLISQNSDQILITLTPHGERPLAWRLREQENWNVPADNARTHIKLWWLPVTDETGKSQWPERISDVSLERLRKLRNSAQQYWLRKRSSEETLFDMDTIRKSFYSFTDRRSSIVYRAVRYDPEELDETGRTRQEEEQVVVELRKLRYFLHFDPLHRTPLTRRSPLSKQRPAKAAIAVVGVNQDLHTFAIDTWTDGSADFIKQIDELFRRYCLFAPHRVTFESIGAQFWVKDYITSLEASRPQWGSPMSSDAIIGVKIPLPRLSTRLVEGEKTNESKEAVFREALSPYTNSGTFHLRADQDEAIYQLQNALNEDVECDLVDAFAQGPAVWSAPLQDVSAREFAARRRKFVERFVKPAKTVFARLGQGGRRWGTTG